MKKKKLSVTIGVPAYNEQNNIAKLLKRIKEQRQNTYKISRIIVISDGSTDKTVKKVKSIRDKRIRLIKNKKRLGQIYCQNKIFSLAKTDVVIILEGDTFPSNQSYIDQIVEPCIKDRSVGLVQGNPKPLPSQSFMGTILSAQAKIYQKFALKENDRIMVFCSGQGGRAFAKKVYTKLKWPNRVPEDSFALLWCQKRKVKCIFQKRAMCSFKPSQSFADFMKARNKITYGKDGLRNYFSQSLIDQIYKRPNFFIIKMSLYFLFSNPLIFMAYTALRTKAKYESYFNDSKLSNYI